MTTTLSSIILSLITLFLVCQSLLSFHVLIYATTLYDIDDPDFISIIYLIHFTFDWPLPINHPPDFDAGVITLVIVLLWYGCPDWTICPDIADQLILSRTGIKKIRSCHRSNWKARAFLGACFLLLMCAGINHLDLGLTGIRCQSEQNPRRRTTMYRLKNQLPYKN
jgi:hypothetical protein